MSTERRTIVEVIKSCNLVDVLNELETIAADEHGGHVTIMRFTTGWKVMFGTPDMTQDGRKEVLELIPAVKLTEAVRLALGKRRLP